MPKMKRIVVGPKGEPVPFKPFSRLIDGFKIVKESWTLEKLLTYMVAFSEGVCVSNLAIYYMFTDDMDLSDKSLSLVYSIPVFPYLFRPFMAYLVDSVPIFGTKRKHYLLINSFILFVCFFLMSVLKTNYTVSVVLYFIISFTSLFCDTVAEFTVAKMSREDTDMLGGYFTVKALSNVVVSYFSGLFVENYPKKLQIFISGLYPLLICYGAWRMREEPEEPVKYQMHPLIELGKFLDKPVIAPVVTFMMIVSITPSFEDVFYYYAMDELGLSRKFIGGVRLMVGVAVVVALTVYRFVFKKTRNLEVLFWTTLMLNVLYFVPTVVTTEMSLEYGIPDKVMVALLGTLFMSTLEVQMMPCLAHSIKVAPQGLEASVLTFMTTLKTAGGFVCKILSSILTCLFEIDTNKFDNVNAFFVFCAICSLGQLLYLSKIPQEHEIHLFLLLRDILKVPEHLVKTLG